MMNKTIILSAFSLISLPLICMQKQDVQVILPHGEIKELVTLATKLLHDKSMSSYLVIEKLKKHLGDESLANETSIAVKTKLVDCLSACAVREYSRDSVRLTKSRSQSRILVTTYLDETSSENRVVNDSKKNETIVAKPRSPWQALTFEEFVRAYLNALQVYGLPSAKLPERAASPNA